MRNILSIKIDSHKQWRFLEVSTYQELFHDHVVDTAL